MFVKKLLINLAITAFVLPSGFAAVAAPQAGSRPEKPAKPERPPKPSKPQPPSEPTDNDDTIHCSIVGSGSQYCAVNSVVGPSQR